MFGCSRASGFRFDAQPVIGAKAELAAFILRGLFSIRCCFRLAQFACSLFYLSLTIMVGYVKIPLLLGCFGFLQAVLMNFIDYYHGLSSMISWNTLSFAALSFAFYSIAGFVLVAFHRDKVKSLTDQTSEAAFSVQQERTLILHLSFGKAFTACKESLSIIDKHWIIEDNTTEGRIFIRTKPTLLEWWRDTVTFTLSKVGDKLTEVKIESRPTGRTPFIDYGKNLGRIEKLADFLEQKEEPLKLPETKEKLENLFGSLREREKMLVK